MWWRWLALACLPSLLASAQQWQRVTSIPAPFATNYWLDVFFLPSNPRYGWICGFNGMVLRTTDGGQTWQGTQIPGANQLESIHFATPQYGYTSGPDGIWRTTDGGQTWTDVTPDSAYALWGCYFLSPTVGMVIGGGCGSIPQLFFRTTDGGTNWSVFVGNEPNSGLTDLMLSADGTGFAVSSGRLWRTTDGGQSWAVFATTGSAVWQEELTHVGNSFLLPFAGTTCSGQGNTGGMRFSTDGGATWREFVTGKPMFGAFLLSPTTGWACGYNGALYYTSDGGQTWQLRDCGIDTTLHLDDIWFVNDTLGWVVGQGVWRYAPPERRFERDTLLFPEVCLPGSSDLTVRLENRSFSATQVTLTIAGADAAAFRLLNFPPNAVLQSCSWTGIPVRFEPSRAGLHRAQLTATFPDGMVRTVQLVGIARTRDGFPETDTLIIPQAPCGIRTVAQLPWHSRDSAAIVRIDWIGGNAGIRAEATPPLPIPRQGVAVPFSALPTDTGWMEARFRVRLQPCAYDTVIVVRAYGISPILTAPATRSYTLHCQLERLDSLPVANTGNDTLLISRYWLDQTPAGTLTIIGWTSGQSFPARIPPGKADTLLLLVQPPTEGVFTAALWLENNDSTKARGQKNPFRLDIVGEARRSLLVSQVQEYDFGRVCLGERRETRLLLENRGTLMALLSQPRVSSPFAAELEDRRNPPLVLGGDSVGLRVRFEPAWEGVFRDTIVLTATPCGERIAIAVRGEGIRAELRLSPQRSVYAAQPGRVDTVTLELAATGSANARIDRFVWDPPAPPWIQLLQPPPGTWLRSGERIPVLLLLTPDSETDSYTGRLCIESDAECPASACAIIDIQPRRLTRLPPRQWAQFCTVLDSVYTLFQLTAPDTRIFIDSVAVVPPTPVFEPVTDRPLPAVLETHETMVFGVRVALDTDGAATAEYRVYTRSALANEVVIVPLSAELRRAGLSIPPDLRSIALGALEPCEAERVVAIPVTNRGSLTDTVLVELLPPTSGVRLRSPSRFALPGNSTDTVFVACSPAALPDGATQVTLRLHGTVCPSQDSVTITLERLTPRLTAYPPELAFGTVWRGEHAEQRVTLTNTSPLQLQVEAIEIVPADAGFTVEGMPPLPLTMLPGEELPLTVRFSARDSGDFAATLRVLARSVCPTEIAVPLSATVPREHYTLRLWIDRHIARPGDTLSIPVWLAGPSERAQVRELALTLSFDPSLFVPVGLQSGTTPLPFRYDGQGRLSFSAIPPHQADTALASTLAVLTGVVLASIPAQTPLHFADVQVTASKDVTLVTEDGALSVLFCGVGRLGIREAGWATAVATREDIRIQLWSPLAQRWSIRLVTTEGRLCWQWEGLVEGSHELSIPTRAMSSGVYVLSVSSAHDGNVFRTLVPIVR